MVEAPVPCAWTRWGKIFPAICSDWNWKCDSISQVKEYNKKHLITFRKKLRRNLTPAEAALWPLLKNRQILGFRFRRQFSVDNYIIDFFCPRAKIAIELDGEVHYQVEALQNDRKRDADLHKIGIQVLRFENKLVFDNTSQVIDAIETALKNRLDEDKS
ncbi:MAG: cytosine methyltransferase [Flavobacteriales bacterium]|nr:MAG: cytosine methyltransferase [Flavobacteriales bacterium]